LNTPADQGRPLDPILPSGQTGVEPFLGSTLILLNFMREAIGFG
jgi:hypothetical protein